MGLALGRGRKTPRCTGATFGVRWPGRGVKHHAPRLDIRHKSQKPRGRSIGERRDARIRREILIVNVCCVVYLSTPLSLGVCSLYRILAEGPREIRAGGKGKRPTTRQTRNDKMKLRQKAQHRSTNE
ncbi:hypothetical protein FKM82_028853 [Ascaphus truei]